MEWTYAVVGCTNAGSVLERAAVDGDAQVDLARSRTVRSVVLDRLVGGDVCASATVDVSLVVRLEE